MLLRQPLLVPLEPSSTVWGLGCAWGGGRLNATVTKPIPLGLRNLEPQGCHLYHV